MKVLTGAPPLSGLTYIGVMRETQSSSFEYVKNVVIGFKCIFSNPAIILKSIVQLHRKYIQNKLALFTSVIPLSLYNFPL